MMIYDVFVGMFFGVCFENDIYVCEIICFGVYVVLWCVKCMSDEFLFCLKLVKFDGMKVICGGVLVCFL